MLKTQTELDASADETILDAAWLNFKRAIQLSVEPAVLFANVYIGLLYAICESESPLPAFSGTRRRDRRSVENLTDILFASPVYLWFEAFPLVYTDLYHFNLGVSVSFVVSSFC